MKVSAFLRKPSKKNQTASKATIYFRVRDKNLDFKSASELSINPNHWSPQKQGYKDRIAIVSEADKVKLEGDIQNITNLIRTNFHDKADSAWLSQLINSYHYPVRNSQNENEVQKKDFFELFEEFLATHKLSDVRKKNFKVIIRSLHRYEKFSEIIQGKKSYKLDLDLTTRETLKDIWNYFENEYLYYEKFPNLYLEITEKRKQQKRGNNTLIDYFNKLRTFYLWCYNNNYTNNRPFDNFKIEEANYGTPIYITLEERDILFAKDLSLYPEIEIQRDIFIFQSLIGCRVSDLFSFTKDSVINNAIEYIQRKTKEGNPITVRVPLNEKAQLILEKYKGHNGRGLFPFVAEQQYNELIKKAFLMAGITRMGTVLDPTTNCEVKKPINEIASSHMARRTFIGNLYKKVKDPNLISALSGHKQGSKAFARYREIDEGLKKEIVSLLD